jgi:molybdate transport repressor ModE-like protein
MQPLLQVGSITSVQRLVLVFQQAGVDRVVLVGGDGDDELERHVAHMGVVFLRVAGGAEMLDGVKAGLTYLTGKCRRTLVTPVDVPLFSVETVKRLMGSRACVAVPSHGRRAGHPMLLSARLFAPVVGYGGADGLAGAIRASGQRVAYIEVSDEGVLWDVRIQRDYEHLLAAHSLRRLRGGVKVYLAREQTFFGPGPFLLLSLIEETESLRTACEQMGISYSKGWRMVENMETQMGEKLVERQRGGREKGRSDITPAGRLLLRRYQRFVRGCDEQARRLFEKIFGETER